MFRRTESSRERALLRLIEQQQQTINNLTDRIMYLAGQTWMPPPLETAQAPDEPEEEQYVSALDGLPPTYGEG